MTSYVQSIYNFQEKDENGRVVLYNSKTGKVVVPSKKLTQAFLSILLFPDKHTLRNQLKRELVKHGFLVASDKDEFMEVKRLHEKAIRDSKQRLSFIIVPTENCNFACPYCFVHDYSRPSMPDDIFEGIYNAILQNLENQATPVKNRKTQSHGKHIKISWMGGEPTLAADKIIRFMDRITGLEKKYPGLSIHSPMVTNGYLLNYDLFRKFADRKIAIFQITIDGDRECHNKTRFLRGSGKDTFDVIYGNLLEIRDKSPNDLKFRIIVRSNFQKDNINSMEAFRSQFKKDFGGDDRFSNYFHGIFRTSNKNENGTVPDSDESVKIRCDYRLNSFNDMDTLNKSAIDDMFNILPQPVFHPCMTTANTFCVSVTGALLACEAIIGNDDDAVGRIHKDGSMEFFKGNSDKWKCSTFRASEVFRKCYSCKLLPFCLGGCRYQKLNKLSEGCVTTEEILRAKLRNYLAKYVEREK